MPRRSKRAADEEAKPPADGTFASPPDALEHGDANGKPRGASDGSSRQIVKASTSIEAVELAGPAELGVGTPESTSVLASPVGPRIQPDPGLYAVLGLDAAASDAEIQSSYRRQAARLLGGGSNAHAALRQLNIAYEVLGNRARREEYDRSRLAQLLAPVGAPTPIRSGAKTQNLATRRSRPRHAVQPNYAGFSYVLAVLLVVGLAVAAGALIILPRLSINLSALNALQNVLPLPSSARRAVEGTVTPGATAAPTPTVPPGVAQRFAGTTVSVSNANPASNTVENVVLKLRHDGQPAVNADVWAIVTYTFSNTVERWPPTGTQKTDASGTATISSNIGRTTAEHPVSVQVFAQVDDQQFSWSTTFTPR